MEDIARLRQIRRMCKMVHPEGSEKGTCPCETPNQCRLKKEEQAAQPTLAANQPNAKP
jgi:hypothetical protein